MAMYLRPLPSSGGALLKMLQFQYHQMVATLVLFGKNSILQESLDLANWTDTGATSSPHTELLTDSKFFRLIASAPEGPSSADEQTFVINVTTMPSGSAYKIAKTVANGNWYIAPGQSLVLENTITVPSVDFEEV